MNAEESKLHRFDVIMGVQKLELSQVYASSNPDGFPDVLFDPSVPVGEFHWRNSSGRVTMRAFYEAPPPRSLLNRVRDFLNG